MCGHVSICLPPEERPHILLHEQEHIRRRDPLVKALFYLALSLHWFNPACWAAFALMSRDMEAACDEAVLRTMGDEVRPRYCRSLPAFASAVGFPGTLSFGEGHTHARVRHMLQYRPPRKSAQLLAAALVVCVTAACAANPVSRETGSGNGGSGENPAAVDWLGRSFGELMDVSDGRFAIVHARGFSDVSFSICCKEFLPHFEFLQYSSENGSFADAILADAYEAVYEAMIDQRPGETGWIRRETPISQIGVLEGGMVCDGVSVGMTYEQLRERLPGLSKMTLRLDQGAQFGDDPSIRYRLYGVVDGQMEDHSIQFLFDLGTEGGRTFLQDNDIDPAVAHHAEIEDNRLLQKLEALSESDAADGYHLRSAYADIHLRDQS